MDARLYFWHFDYYPYWSFPGISHVNLKVPWNVGKNLLIVWGLITIIVTYKYEAKKYIWIRLMIIGSILKS